MASIGLLAHSSRQPALELAEDTRRWLHDQGHTTRMLDGDPGGALLTGCDRVDVSDLDLVVSLGGDGTMLRTVGLVGESGVPVRGVNLGHLGYLTAVEPGDLRAALRRWLDGDYQVEARMTLEVTLTDADGTTVSCCALNEVVLQRDTHGHTVWLDLWVNGSPFLTFVADSLIVATATGSTAYNLSARGPIVSPRARVQVVTPVAPHNLFDRSLVLDCSEEVSLRSVEGRRAKVVVDGFDMGVLAPGSTLTCRAGVNDAHLVTFGEREFTHVLKRKFNLTDR